MLVVLTVAVLASNLLVHGSPNSRGPDEEIDARGLTQVFKVKTVVGDTAHVLYSTLNNVIWCGKPNCPTYPSGISKIKKPLILPPLPGKKPVAPGISKIKKPPIVPSLPGKKPGVPGISKIKKPPIVPSLPGKKPGVPGISKIKKPPIVPLVPGKKPSALKSVPDEAAQKPNPDAKPNENPNPEEARRSGNTKRDEIAITVKPDPKTEEVETIPVDQPPTPATP